MDTKLTLKLNKSIIEKAKTYAQKNNTSLSQIVEKYFIALITEKENETLKLTPLVKELSGIIKPENIENYKDDYAKYLMKKYK
ncbi:MAG: DUF6364 family protein [Spirochaetota bacterium]|nr:DUF6364 family protein [Spirochaetota bacterium]OPZ37630.1 MAG: hypothetical protein BWY96_01603 [Spirochaetes bacterium ADurb.BinA120]HPI14256.1 DUF6364 family protein [Spirochaetota bacterium]